MEHISTFKNGVLFEFILREGICACIAKAIFD